MIINKCILELMKKSAEKKKPDGAVIVKCMSCGGQNVYSQNNSLLVLDSPDPKCGCQKGKTMRWHSDMLDAGVAVVSNER